jgi:hypothetical protein
MRMRISVHSRCSKRGSEPGSICLGQARLRVAAILERRDLADSDYFEVRVLDGREFVLSHRRQTDAWELTAVRAQMPRIRFFTRCGQAFAAFAHAWRIPSS